MKQKNAIEYEIKKSEAKSFQTGIIFKKTNYYDTQTVIPFKKVFNYYEKTVKYFKDGTIWEKYGSN